LRKFKYSRGADGIIVKITILLSYYPQGNLSQIRNKSCPQPFKFWTRLRSHDVWWR